MDSIASQRMKHPRMAVTISASLLWLLFIQPALAAQGTTDRALDLFQEVLELPAVKTFVVAMLGFIVVLGILSITMFVRTWREARAEKDDNTFRNKLLDLSTASNENTRVANKNLAVANENIAEANQNAANMATLLQQLAAIQKTAADQHVQNSEYIQHQNAQIEQHTRAMQTMTESVNTLHRNVTGGLQQVTMAVDGFRSQIAALIELLKEMQLAEDRNIQRIETTIRETIQGARVTSEDLEPIMEQIAKWREVEMKEHALLMQKIIELHSPQGPPPTEPNDELPPTPPGDAANADALDTDNVVSMPEPEPRKKAAGE